MFGVGLGELAVIAFVAVLVVGPERLPELARQAGRIVRQLKSMADQARDDLRQELGPEYADLELADLDPRVIVRRHLAEALEDGPAASVGTAAAATGSPAARARSASPAQTSVRATPTLAPGELPPFDPEAT